MKRINIEFTGSIVEAELNNTDTAEKIFDSLPVIANINRWGDEIYFEIPVDGHLENETETVEEGTLAFWPPGNAFCIFFGPTPASTDQHPRAAGPVTIIGRILKETDFKILRNTSDGQEIQISR